jgi:hypothetical protein
MGINYQNLDSGTRAHMALEIGMGGQYMSPRLTAQGKLAWSGLLSQAANTHNTIGSQANYSQVR